MAAVEGTLEEIGATEAPRLVVLNKIDLIDADQRHDLALRHPDAVLVSALSGEGIDDLRDAIELSFRSTLRSVDLLLPYSDGGRLARAARARGGRTRARGHRRRCARARAAAGGCGRPFRPLPRQRERMRLPIRRLHPQATLPRRAHEDDAGLDLHALEPTVLEAGARARVRTGIAIELPPGHAGMILPRSGLADRHGIALVNAPGLIDAGYRGEIEVLLLNTDRDTRFEIAAGDRVAQLVVVAVAGAEPIEVEEAGAKCSSRRRLRLDRRLSQSNGGGSSATGRRAAATSMSRCTG